MKRSVIAIGAAILILLLSCPGMLQAADTPSKANKATTALSAALQPQPGGIYKVILRTKSNVFGYPPRIVGAARDFAAPFFDHLLYVGDDGKYHPGLALSWDTAKDGKTITFKLRKGVTFHDGTPFNAQAVKSNIDNLLLPEGAIIPGINSVNVIDENTVKLNLPQYSNLIFYQLAVNPATYMYSPEALKKNGVDWAMTHPVGTGPFVLKDYQPNISLSLVKNPHYWQKGLPYLDGIEMSMVSDPMTQLMTLKAGQANAIYAALSAAATQLRNDGYPLQTAPGGLWVINFDARNSDTFSKRPVREAIEYAIDKESICKGPGEGLYKPVFQILADSSPDYNKSCKPRTYNPAKAKKLLAEAGYPNGFSFKIFSNDTSWRDGLVAIQSYLSAVGITMDINYLNVSAFNLIRSGGKIEKGAAAFTSNTLSLNSLYYLDSFWRSNSSVYPYVVKPNGIDKLIDEAKLSRNQAAITRINQQILKLLYDDETVAPLWYESRVAVVDKSVQNSGWFVYGDENNNQFGLRTWLKK